MSARTPGLDVPGSPLRPLRAHRAHPPGRSGVRSQSSDRTWRRTSARNDGDPFAGASKCAGAGQPCLEPLSDEPAHAAAEPGRRVADAARGGRWGPSRRSVQVGSGSRT